MVHRPILHIPLLPTILRHYYCSEPFDALLVAVILVYRPLLRDETSSQVQPCKLHQNRDL